MRRPALCAVVGLIASCGGAPQYHYLILSPEAPAKAPSAISVQSVDRTHATIHLPGLLDRLQLVTRSARNIVEIHEFERWAEPLDQMASRVLNDDLALRMGPVSPHVGDSGRRQQIAVDIDEFIAAADGSTTLAGNWRDRSRGQAGGHDNVVSFSLSGVAINGQSEAIAKAMSGLLARLADEIISNPAATALPWRTE